MTAPKPQVVTQLGVDIVATKEWPDVTQPTSEPMRTVPKRWVDEMLLALSAATNIGNRRRIAMNYTDHDRLIAEAHANGWSKFGETSDECMAWWRNHGLIEARDDANFRLPP